MKTQDSKIIELSQVSEINDTLTEILRQGARTMLATAVESEVQDFLAKHDHIRDDNGHKQVVRNGYLPERTIQSGVGDIDVKVPRVRDNSGQAIKFTSTLLPPYLKRTRSVEELLPWLYLKGISTGGFQEALQALLGKEAKCLSPNTICRLKSVWSDEYKGWQKRDLSSLNIAYIWADGVYLKTRLGDKNCILVIIGADNTGKKHVLALQDGYRESSQSWYELLLDLKSRGLTKPPKLAVGDGAMGFWNALSKVYPDAAHQRCWLHKTMNILNCLPKTLHDSAKSAVQAIWMADTEANAELAYDLFIEKFSAKYPKATECLEKDKDSLFTFYSFPAQHWHHIRTTNPIESVFATIKLRTAKTRNCLSKETGFAMLYKLAMSAEKRWPKLRGSAMTADVIRGVKFKDGEKVLENAA